MELCEDMMGHGDLKLVYQVLHLKTQLNDFQELWRHPYEIAGGGEGKGTA